MKSRAASGQRRNREKFGDEKTILALMVLGMFVAATSGTALAGSGGSSQGTP
jgi:hypothetical protein